MNECKETAIVAFGTNIEPRFEWLKKMKTEVEIAFGSNICWSRAWESTPVGGALGDLNYLNGAFLTSTSLDSTGFLLKLKELERTIGRTPRDRWGAREMDLDLIYYGNQVLQTPLMTVPHIERARRWFVMKPVAEVAPRWVDPILGKTTQELADALQSEAHLKIYTWEDIYVQSP